MKWKAKREVCDSLKVQTSLLLYDQTLRYSIDNINWDPSSAKSSNTATENGQKGPGSPAAFVERRETHVWRCRAQTGPHHI